MLTEYIKYIQNHSGFILSDVLFRPETSFEHFNMLVFFLFTTGQEVMLNNNQMAQQHRGWLVIFLLCVKSVPQSLMSSVEIHCLRHPVVYSVVVTAFYRVVVSYSDKNLENNGRLCVIFILSR